MSFLQPLIGAVDDFLQKKGQAPQISAGQPAPMPVNTGTPRIGAVGATPGIFAGPTGLAPAKIGAAAVPQPTAQPSQPVVDTYDPSKSPMVGAGSEPTPNYAARYHDWAASEPAQLSLDAGKPSTLRKIGGIATAGLIGALNQQAGAQIGSAIINGPRRELVAKHNQAEDAWNRQGREIQTESSLANTGSEIKERQDKPILEAQKEADADKREQDRLSQQTSLETQREAAAAAGRTQSEAASEKRTGETLAASEKRTQEQIAASDRRTDKTIAAADARGSQKETPFDRANAEAASKDTETARGGDFRYRSMAGSLPKAKGGDQQAMLNLLTNHIGMTLGMQKGARITKDILNEAQKSTPWLQGVKAKFDDQGYLSGVVLTPQQMDQMMGLAESQRGNAWAQAIESARQAGVADKVQVPADVRIRVVSPDGKPGTIPGGQLAQAEAAGYTVAPQ